MQQGKEALLGLAKDESGADQRSLQKAKDVVGADPIAAQETNDKAGADRSLLQEAKDSTKTHSIDDGGSAAEPSDRFQLLPVQILE